MHCGSACVPCLCSSPFTSLFSSLLFLLSTYPPTHYMTPEELATLFKRRGDFDSTRKDLLVDFQNSVRLASMCLLSKHSPYSAPPCPTCMLQPDKGLILSFTSNSSVGCRTAIHSTARRHSSRMHRQGLESAAARKVGIPSADGRTHHKVNRLRKPKFPLLPGKAHHECCATHPISH